MAEHVPVSDEKREQSTPTDHKLTIAGHERLRAWAHGLSEGKELRVALEDCHHVNGRLERFLLAHSELVLRGGTRLMANTRQSARTYGKSDSIDALAIAQAALRAPNLPRAIHDPKLRELKLLVDHGEDLVSERTAAGSSLRWLLHDLVDLTRCVGNLL